jgi:hypothetical protein
MAESTVNGWYYLPGGAATGQPVGPLTWEQLYALARSGSLNPGDMVWHETMPQWAPAAQIGGLFATTAPPAYQQPQKGSGLLGLLIALIALVIVGAALGTYFGFFYDKDEGGTAPAADVTAADLEGRWEGTFTYRTLDVEGISGEERKLAEKALNKKLPLVMEVAVYEDGEGVVEATIDMTPVDERIGSTYETLHFTYVDGKLTLEGTEFGTKASGTLTQKGDKLIWEGSLEFKDMGNTSKADYRVEKAD